MTQCRLQRYNIKQKHGVDTELKYNVKRLVVLGMLIAVEIVLSRFVSIATDTLKISLAFAPVMIAALLYGPVWAGVVGALADIIGALLFPIGAYFPGFTVTAFLTGMVFGAFLYNRKVKWLDASTAAAVVCVALNMLLNSYVLYLYYVLLLNKANAVALVIAALPGRVITNSVMIVVQTIINCGTDNYYHVVCPRGSRYNKERSG
jgi:Predicted membrane protein